MVYIALISMRVYIISCRQTHFLKGHFPLRFQESLQRLITCDKELISQDQVLQTFISLFKACHVALLLKIPPESIYKLLRGFTILDLALLKALTVASLRKTKSLQKIFLENLIFSNIVIRHPLIHIQGLTL